jgi:hypothetical protein
MASYDEIKEYIKSTLKQGHSEKAIRNYLIKEEKISESLVNKAFDELSVKQKPSVMPSIKMPSIQTLEIIGLVLFIILIVFLFVSLFSGTNACTDSTCFIEKAQNCNPSTLTIDEVGSKVLLEIKSDCTLEKSISEFGPDEPTEVIVLFQNKKMSCSYTQGGFDETWISSLVAGIDSCAGDLKDAIFELKLAQYELLQE